MAQQLAYLQTVSLTQLPNWSVQYLLEAKFSYNNKYSLQSIGSFLTRDKTQVRIDDSKTYKRVRIKVNNGGVSLRDKEHGNNIGTKKQFLVKTGQFLLSKIDARNGAFGVVPTEVDGAIITGNFWTFDVDTSTVNPHFLALITTTSEFIRFCENASNGTTNRHYLQENLFLEQVIPLPSLEEQNRVLAAYQKKIQEAEQLEAEAKDLEGVVEEYFFTRLGAVKHSGKEKSYGLTTTRFSQLPKWSLTSGNFQKGISFDQCQFPLFPIGGILEFFEGGKTPSKSRPDYWNGEIAWCSPKDFSGFQLLETQDHITDFACEEAGLKKYPPGTVLSVFRSGILRHSFPTIITKIHTTINQDLKAYSLDSGRMSNEYFLYFANTFKSYILQNASKTGVTVESMNSPEFLELLIPLPPLEIQQEIARHISDLRYRIGQRKQQASNNRQKALEEFEKEIFS